MNQNEKEHKPDQNGQQANRTKILAEVAIFSSLSAVLYAIKLFILPYGLSITIGSFVPVMWLSLRRGVKTGLFAGTIFGILAFFVDSIIFGPQNVAVNPVQFVLEYPIAFALLGLAGVFHKKTTGFALAGTCFAIFVKFLIHAFAGYIFWVYVYQFPEEWGVWWPVVSNGSFHLVESVVSLILLSMLVKRRTLDYRL